MGQSSGDSSMTRAPATTWAPAAFQRLCLRLFPAFAVGAFVTVLLVVTMGGIVRVSGSGLGCPDWPLCHGRVIPPPDIKAWTEYLHRLSVTLNSVFVLGAAVTAFAGHGWRREARLPLFAPLLLVVQAVLGGFTVLTELGAVVALVHTVVAMAYVATLTLMMTGARPWAPRVTSPVAAGLRRLVASRKLSERQVSLLKRASLLTAAAAFLLILSGSYVYRSGAPLACLSYPFCGTEALTSEARGQQDIHMLHRYVAAATVLATAFTAWLAWRARGAFRQLLWLATAVSLLVALQVALGASNVLFRLPSWARLMHLVFASVTFAAMVMLAATVRGRANE
jgi:heme A synthase